eukprot:1124400-Pyramimonas_sp.AAC.1
MDCAARRRSSAITGGGWGGAAPVAMRGLGKGPCLPDTTKPMSLLLKSLFGFSQPARLTLGGINPEVNGGFDHLARHLKTEKELADLFS